MFTVYNLFMIKIWIDDTREKPVEYKVCVKSYQQFLNFIRCYNRNKNMNKEELFVDFDHDLGDGKSGYDIAKYIVENNIQLYGFRIHSMNPIGVENIRSLLTYYGYEER